MQLLPRLTAQWACRTVRSCTLSCEPLLTTVDAGSFAAVGATDCAASAETDSPGPRPDTLRGAATMAAYHKQPSTPELWSCQTGGSSARNTYSATAPAARRPSASQQVQHAPTAVAGGAVSSSRGLSLQHAITLGAETRSYASCSGGLGGGAYAGVGCH